MSPEFNELVISLLQRIEEQQTVMNEQMVETKVKLEQLPKLMEECKKQCHVRLVPLEKTSYLVNTAILFTKWTSITVGVFAGVIGLSAAVVQILGFFVK